MNPAYLLLLALTLLCSGQAKMVSAGGAGFDTIISMEIHLSAFGVEADDYPSIDGFIDFKADTARCRKWFYDSAYKNSVYTLNKDEIKKVLDLLESTDWDKAKKKYTTNLSDQPTSTIIIYTTTCQFKIEDYGLQGEEPLREIYRLVYRM